MPFSNKNNIGVILVALFFLLLNPAVVSAARWYDPTEIYTPPAVPAGTPCTNNCTWYIDGTNGSDSYNGFYPTFQGGSNGPFKTIGKMFDRYATRDVRGKRVLIKGGRYYTRRDGQMEINNNWTYGTQESERFIIAAYDNTEVILDHSFSYNLGAWSNYSGSIWKSTMTGNMAGKTADYLVINNDFRTYRPKTSLGNVTAEGHWYFNISDNTLYVWTPTAIGDPSNDNVLLGTFSDGGWDSPVKLQSGVNYVTLQHLTMQGGDQGIYDQGSAHNRMILSDLVMRFNTKQAISINLNDSEVRNSYFWANAMRNWPRARWNTSSNCEYISSGGWPTIYSSGNGYSNNVLISGNVFWQNGGESIGVGGISTSNPSFIIDGNAIGNSWSVGIYPDSLNNVIIRNNYVAVTEVSDADIADECTTALGKQKVRRRMRSVGIMIGDEDPNNNVKHFEIYNNIVVNAGAAITTYFESNPNGLIDSIISNNTVMHNLGTLESGVDCYGLSFNNSFGDNNNSVIVGNIVYFNNSAMTCRAVNYLGAGEMDSGVTWDNNLYYAPGNSTPFNYKGTSYGFSNWKTQTGQDANSINSNPQFTMTEVLTPWWKTLFGVTGNTYKLLASSPAIGAASDMSTYYTTDYEGNNRTGTWDVGAYEYQASGGDTIPPAVPTGLIVN